MRVLTALFLLTACAAPELDPAPKGLRDPCGAQAHQDLVGAPRAAAATRAFAAERVRLISPGMAVTTDFIPTRLNILIGETGRVRAVRCG